MSRPTGSKNADTLVILKALATFLDPDRPVSLRYCVYHLISMGEIKSTEQYGKIMNIINVGRIDGTIDDECLVDHKRRAEKPATWTDLSTYRDFCARFYKLDRWQDQPEHVEVWIEKDTTSFLVEDVARAHQVPLRISSGFYSRSFLYKAAKELSQITKPITIFYIGDFDAAGLQIERCSRVGNGESGGDRREGLIDILMTKFNWTGSDLERINWTRLAATADDLRTLPDTAKVRIKVDRKDKKDDVNAARYREQYGDFGVEVEALEVMQAGLLADRLEAAIKDHIDLQMWKESETQEGKDRNELLDVA